MNNSAKDGAAQPSQVSAEQWLKEHRDEFLTYEGQYLDEVRMLEAYQAALAATPPQPQKCERSLTIRYTNYRGETSDRSIEPGRIYFGSTEWHPEEQWLLEAFDFDRKAGRTFALKDIQWKTKAYASSREQK